MTTRSSNRLRTPWRRLRLLAAFSLVAVVANPGAASAQTGAVSPEGLTIIQMLFGDDYTHMPTGSETADPTDDSVNFAGDDVPGQPGLTQAGVHEVDGRLMEDALEAVCAEGSEPMGPGSSAICPADRAELLAAEDFLFAIGLHDSDVDDFAQFTWLWAEEGLEVYDGAPGDPNNNETDSFDLFATAAGLALGRTLYRNGSFEFDPEFATAMAFLGPKVVALLVPRDQFVSTCTNVAFALILQGGIIDKASLPDDPTGTFQKEEAPPPPEDVPPAEEPPPLDPPQEPPAPAVVDEPAATPGADPPVVPDPPTPAPAPEPEPAAPPAAAPDSGDDGGGSAAPIAIAIVVIALIIAAFLYSRTRRRAAPPETKTVSTPPTSPPTGTEDPNPPETETVPKPPPPSAGKEDDCEEERRAYASARAAVAPAAARVDAANQAWLEADATGDQAAIDAARAAAEAAVAAQGDVIDAEFKAMAALNACLGQPPPTPPAAEEGPSSGGGRTSGPTAPRAPRGPNAGDTSGGDDDAPADDTDGGEDGGDDDEPPEVTPPIAPGDDCPRGHKKSKVEKTQEYVIPNGNVTVDISPSTTQWRTFVTSHGGEMPSNASFSVDAFEALDEGAVAVGLAQVSSGRITATVRLPVKKVTMTCLRVYECDGQTYLPTDETEVKSRTSELTLNWSIRRRRSADNDASDMSTPGAVIAAAQAEIGQMATGSAPSTFDCP